MDDVGDRLAARVERALLRCVTWSQEGRHRRVLQQVEQLLPLARHSRQLTATLLIWKAQALLTMGFPDRALEAAEGAWELESSPHACHVQASALTCLGEAASAEDLLLLGSALFPSSIHLPLQLAILYADQGRVPEALTVLEDLPVDGCAEDDLAQFVIAMRADLLAAGGRWADALELLEEGLRHEPQSSILHDAQESIANAHQRQHAERRLARTWQQGLGELTHTAAEVDEAIVHLGVVTESSQLTILAARRLWRAFSAHSGTSVLAPDPWAAASLLAVVELDGSSVPAVSWARSTATSPHSVRSNLRRIRSFIKQLDHEFARRSFAAHTNPMLESLRSETESHDPLHAHVIPFPVSRRPR